MNGRIFHVHSIVGERQTTCRAFHNYSGLLCRVRAPHNRVGRFASDLFECRREIDAVSWQTLEPTFRWFHQIMHAERSNSSSFLALDSSKNCDHIGTMKMKHSNVHRTHVLLILPYHAHVVLKARDRKAVTSSQEWLMLVNGPLSGNTPLKLFCGAESQDLSKHTTIYIVFSIVIHDFIALCGPRNGYRVLKNAHAGRICFHSCSSIDCRGVFVFEKLYCALRAWIEAKDKCKDSCILDGLAAFAMRYNGHTMKNGSHM